MSRLRYLILAEVTDSQVIEYLTHDVNWASLETLAIESEDSSGLQALLEKLQPLKDLRLAGSVVPALIPEIFHRHGPTLRRLTLGLELASQEIARIQDSCPLLVYVKYKIPKSVLEDLEQPSLGDICPNLHCLSELVLEVHGNVTDIHEQIRKVWDFINNNKKGLPLNCLYLIYNSPVSRHAARIDRTKFDNIDEVVIEDVVWNGDIMFDMSMMQQFHGLPAAEFRRLEN